MEQFKGRRKALLVGAIVTLGALSVAVVLALPAALSGGPMEGPRTGVSVLVDLAPLPDELRLDGPLTCYELDLSGGGFGAEISGGPLLTEQGTPIDVTYAITVTAGGREAGYESSFRLTPNPEPQGTLFPLGDYSGDMIEIPRGLSACELELSVSPG